MNAPAIQAMSPAAIARVGELEARSATLPQVEIATHHVLQAGIYARTILVPADTLLTGALVEIETIVIVNGDCTVALGDGRTERLTGYHVLPADGGRKQAYLAHADTWLTMLFATSVTSVEAAEDAFTAEAHKLMSRQPGHANTVHLARR